jgi:hypothetical protein
MLWWVPPLAIPFWGMVLWLSVNSPFRLGDDPLPVIEAQLPAVGLEGCRGARVILDGDGRLLGCDWNQIPTIRPYPSQRGLPMGDFPDPRERRHHDLGRGERGFPTLRIQGH